MKTENINNINDGLLELLPGIPVEHEYKEPWKKACYSCSGAGRIESKFDLLLMKTVFEGLKNK